MKSGNVLTPKQPQPKKEGLVMHVPGQRPLPALCPFYDDVDSDLGIRKGPYLAHRPFLPFDPLSQLM